VLLVEISMHLTVAICTWNRANLLDQTLTRMHLLRIPAGVDWELLIVNNNCTDATDEVIVRHRHALPIRRLLEARQGHCHARNCAIDAARGDLLLWTDDDVLVDTDWLAEHVRASQEWPEAVFFGGVVDPWFSRTPPRWIQRLLPGVGGKFAIRQLGDEVRLLYPNELPVGANLSFRTQVLKRFPFDTNIGYNKTNPTGGDDYKVVSQMREAGYKGVWVGTARVLHYIPPERLTARYFWRSSVGNSQSICRTSPPLPGARVWGAPRWAWRAYYTNQMLRYFFAPFSTKRWFEAFERAAFYRGVIDEERSRWANSELVGSPSSPGQ
jgi:glycosyltransferase involved in cell wall biosynthesis